MLRKLGRMMLVGLVMLVLLVKESAAGEIDLLVQKLVDKGVLTAGEAQELVIETHEQIRKQNAMGTNDLIPAWVQNTKLKGDVRVRFESIKDKGAKYLTHERLRVRLGMDSKVNDQMKVGIGIATGKSTDPRSRNVSLGNDGQATSTDYTPASGKSVILDYAYAEYTPIQYATITAGKFQNPLWYPWDMIWKGDITPEGAALKLNYSPASWLQLYMNNMVFVLRNKDAAGTKEPRLFAFQPGASWNITDKITLKSAIAYYSFTGLQNQPVFSYSKGQNTTVGGKYVYNYDSLSPSMEVGVKEPLGGLVPYAAIFGDYIYNVSGKHPPTGRGGFDTGVKFGYEKVADKSQWQVKLATSKLGRDAWVDAFTDSDRYAKGKSNAQSYEGIFEYGLGKNSSLLLDYYYSFLLNEQSAGGRVPEQLVQLDWNLKF